MKPQANKPDNANGPRVRRGPFLFAGLAAGVLIAFPAGIYVARRTGDPAPVLRTPSSTTGATRMRNMYSPVILKDPAFLEQQKRGIGALEAHCRATGEDCETARAARRWYEKTTG